MLEQAGACYRACSCCACPAPLPRMASLLHPCPAAAPVTAAAASPCGSLALTGDAQGGIKLWSLANGTLLGASTAGEPSAAIAAACFVGGGAAATAQEGGSAVQVWSTEGGRLSLVGQLDAAGSGNRCTVTALAAAGPLLALGCSDGSTQVWRYSGGELEQHARVPAPCGNAAPACCLALSAGLSAPLLAVAAGTAVAVVDTAGELLAERQLATAPAALYWSSSGELYALLSDGWLQRLGAPKPAAAETAVAAPPRKKAVRFADQQASSPAAGNSGGLPAEEAVSSRQHRPGGGPASLAPADPLLSLSGRSALPPLPSHPLLRGSSAGSALAQLPSTAAPTSGSMGCGTSNSRQPAALPRSCRPTYPILDLRALQGLRPAAAHTAGGTAAAAAAAAAGGEAARVGRNCLAENRQQQSVVGSLPPSSQRQKAAPSLAAAAGMSPKCGTQHSPVQAVMLDAPADRGQQTATGACQIQQEGVLDTPNQAAESPQPRRLPRALLHCSQPPSAQPLTAARVSKQRCDACRVLETADAPASRPASPAKAALLAQVEQPGREAAVGSALCAGGTGSSGACGSRPVSPVKPGVVCTREAQLAGELLPAEVRAFTGVLRAAVWSALCLAYLGRTAVAMLL